jgi:ankyrin repeat protein
METVAKRNSNLISIYTEEILFNEIKSETPNVELIENILKNTPELDLNRLNEDGHHIVTLAAIHGHTKVLKVLLRDERIDVNNHKNIFKDVVLWNDKVLLKLLLDHPLFDPTVTNEEGVNAFMFASGSLPVLKKLFKLKPNVNINHRDKEGQSLLQWALWDKDSKVIEFLLKIPGIDLKLSNPYSWHRLDSSFKKKFPQLDPN